MIPAGFRSFAFLIGRCGCLRSRFGRLGCAHMCAWVAARGLRSRCRSDASVNDSARADLEGAGSLGGGGLAPFSFQLVSGWTSRRALHRGRKLSRRHSRCGCRVPPPQDACAAGEGRLHPQQRSSGFYGNFSGYSVLTRDGRHIFAIFSHCSALRRFLRGIPCRGTAGLTGPHPFPTIAERSRRAQRSRVSFALACSCRRVVDRNGYQDDAWPVAVHNMSGARS